MKTVLAQLSPYLGDISRNTEQVIHVIQKMDPDTDLVVFPELFLTGYPPRDLLFFDDIQAKITHAIDQLQTLSGKVPEIGFVVGLPYYSQDMQPSKQCLNSAWLFYQGKTQLIAAKQCLPNYDIFDESRYFRVGEPAKTLSFKGRSLGVLICEDFWAGLDAPQHYDYDPTSQLLTQNPDQIIVLSASPFYADKPTQRLQYAKQIATTRNIGITFVNQSAAIDEVIFDGSSFSVSSSGNVIAAAPSFKTDLLTFNLDTKKSINLDVKSKPEALFQALCFGVSEYLNRSGFSKVVLGISGGIDSALVAAIAVSAIGPNNVVGLAMPTPYSSQQSLDDAKILAKTLGFTLNTHDISDLFSAFQAQIQARFQSLSAHDIPLQNIQARLRGDWVMTYANTLPALGLATGNKSELAMGYCTLGGDLSGSLAVIGDLYKSQVYEIAKWLQNTPTAIPESILNRPPSAELKPDQLDTDSLPPYDLLDPICQGIIEENLGMDSLVRRGFPKATVQHVFQSIQQSEYKRAQTPVVLKVSPTAFGIGRRFATVTQYG